MADEETPDPDASDASSDNDSDSSVEVEWLAKNREKRSTAGNRMRAIIAGEDEELDLLFEEPDDDVGFSDAEAADSDVQMDSSSDDEDAAAPDDEMEGEKELQKAVRAEKVKKRRTDGMPIGYKKKVRVDHTVVAKPPPRPKKKSERASWLATAEDAPTRASARGSTREQKQLLNLQLADRDIKRLKQNEHTKKVQAAKEAAKKPPMTQEDRLKEAARVEKSNFRSLSRWEEAEQAREKEQQEKLAALKNRTMDGPVITWWSGLGEWVGGKLRQVGKNLVIEEKEKATKKRKAAEMEESETGSVAQDETKEDDKQVEPEASKDKTPSIQETTTTPARKPSIQEPISTSFAPAIPHGAFPNPEPSQQPPHQAPPPPRHIPPPGPPRSSVLAPPAGLPLSAPPPGQHSGYRPYYMPPPVLDGSMPLPGFGTYPPFMASTPSTLTRPPPGLPPPNLPPPPPAIEHAACNYLILENFDETLIKNKDVQTQIIFGRKFIKAPRSKASHEVCAITGHPARYRDPNTGLPYHSAYAYKEIQKLKRSEYKWSKLVGAYVGLGTYAARGVPERFRRVERSQETAASSAGPSN